jgi:hypothetical protein
VHSDCAVPASVIVAGEGATFEDVAHFSAGVAPGDGIFTTWSYGAGAGSKVTMIDRNGRLMSKEDLDVRDALRSLLAEEGIDILLNSAPMVNANPRPALRRNVFIRHSPPFHSSTHSVKYEARPVSSVVVIRID